MHLSLWAIAVAMSASSTNVRVVVEASSLLQIQAQTRSEKSRITLVRRDRSRPLDRASTDPESDVSTPAHINNLDLWGIRDLLLLGKAAPLLPDDSPHRPAVQAGADSLAEMLSQIHPVPACRTAIGDAGSLEAKAAACWSCLGLTKANFTDPYDPDKDKYQNSANTATKFDDKLGACSGSRWPRACSFWSSFHAMSVLADAQDNKDYLDAISRIVAGGALYCGGCTLHYRYLMKHMLPTDLNDVRDTLPY